MTFKIMLASAGQDSRRQLERLFRRDYQVLGAGSGAEALGLLEQHDVALLVADERVDGMTGIELVRHAAALRPHMVRIILAGDGGMNEVFDATSSGQVYCYVMKPWDDEDLRLTVMRALEHYVVNRAQHETEEANKRPARRVQARTRGGVRAIVGTLEAKDRHVYGHAQRVSGYSVAIGRRMRLGVPLLCELSLAALMHDVGKISTPDSILLKPAALTDDECAVVSLHAGRGTRLLADIAEMEETAAAAAVRHRHENFDGTGYPDRLAGERIPVASRVIRVADAYDAMTSPRPSRAALGHEAAVAELLKGAGTLFDPEVVRAFCGLEALAKIRDHIARGDFGASFLSVKSPTDLRRMPLEDLIREVESEPVLCAAVLRAANAGQIESHRTASLYTACARVGAGALRDIIARADVCERVDYEAEALRDHSRRCATAAMLLAEKTGTLDPDEAYTAGLLHDLGEALLRSLFPEEAGKIIWLGHPFRIEKEVAAFGVDHAQVGQWILDACHVPAALSFAVQTYHDLDHVSDLSALLLHVADAIACAHDSSEVAALDSFTPDRLALLRLSRADLARVHELTTEMIGERFDSVAA